MAEIVLDRVCKQFVARGPLIVRDLNLHIEDGEALAIVGRSGCGKTTLLRLIAGLETLTSGRILFHQRDVSAVQPRERNVGMVFQDSALYPHMTCAANMAFALQMRRVPRNEIDRRVRDAAAMLHVTELLPRKPATLSGGQRQRIALGRAIVRLPEANCLLLDEPLSHLDADLRADLRQDIRRLHATLKPTLIFVTHDMEDARVIGQRIVRMDAGTLTEHTTPAGTSHASSQFG